MDNESKPREELITELHQLRQEFIALKASYEGDITLRNKIGEALKDSEEKYRALLNGSTLGILAVDIETFQFVFANPAAVKLFGYSNEELSGMNLAEMHPKEEMEAVFSEMAAQWRGENTVSRNLPCLRKDGTIFYADIAGYTAILNGRKCSVGFILDVTERKKMEEEIKQEQNEIKQLNTHFIGRELKMIELKKEVNELLKKAGLEKKYDV
jgi:PAS domain S-box-containing protein